MSDPKPYHLGKGYFKYSGRRSLNKVFSFVYISFPSNVCVEHCDAFTEEL